jgi:hypothetical protein
MGVFFEARRALVLRGKSFAFGERVPDSWIAEVPEYYLRNWERTGIVAKMFEPDHVPIPEPVVAEEPEPIAVAQSEPDPIDSKPEKILPVRRKKRG